MRFVFLALLLTTQEPARSGMKPPDEVDKTFSVAAGLALRTWAHEPHIVNPTSIDIDERGRVWAVQAVNYVKSKLAPEGDRIVILEDTKGNGVCDSAKVFVQDKSLHTPLGICVAGNKVYVSQAPRLLVYTI